MRNYLSILILSLTLAPALAQDTQGAIQPAPPAISMAERGLNARGEKLYSIIANGQNITDVLKKLFTTLGYQYNIHQDVSGTIDIRLLGATEAEILREVSEAARPPLRISRDEKGVYRVSRELVTSPTGIVLGPGNLNPPGVVPLRGGGAPVIGYPQLIYGSRPVTLDVPDDRRIPLADALRQISNQTGIQIVLDRRIPRDVEFSGTITRAPVSLVLQQIADTAGLKLIVDANGATLTPPDQFLIRVRDFLMGTYTSQACPNCGQRLIGAWKYCPNCSRVTPIGERDLRSRGPLPKRVPGKAGKIGGY